MKRKLSAFALAFVLASCRPDAEELIPPLVEDYTYPDSVNSSRIRCAEDDPCWVPELAGYTCYVGLDGLLHPYTEDVVLPDNHHPIYCPGSP